VSRIQADKDLPEHKVVASLDDLDRAILEMHQKDVFFHTPSLPRNGGDECHHPQPGWAPEGIRCDGSCIGDKPLQIGTWRDIGNLLSKNSKIPGVANTESFIGLDLHEQKFELGVID
jgi:hypothetical protein